MPGRPAFWSNPLNCTKRILDERRCPPTVLQKTRSFSVHAGPALSFSSNCRMRCCLSFSRAKVATATLICCDWKRDYGYHFLYQEQVTTLTVDGAFAMCVRS